jgi:hypothetical protein
VIQQLVLLAVFAGLGVAAQRPLGRRARTALWSGFFWLVSPALVLR